MSPDPVDAILGAYGFRGPWERLPATGVANRIYATAEVVLRIATDHADAVPDARTESVAAPAAYCAPVRTPLLIVFDDSRALVDRPLSIWERVHAETFGRCDFAVERRQDLWREVGQELARLHDRVRSCPDPRGWLDPSGCDLALHDRVSRLRDAGTLDPKTAREMERLIDELTPLVTGAVTERCFLHQDLHEMNVMCSARGSFVALIDWGDAGWGDPAEDFHAIPLEMMPAALDGYGAGRRRKLGACPEARFAWMRLARTLDRIDEGRPAEGTIGDLRRFLDGGLARSVRL